MVTERRKYKGEKMEGKCFAYNPEKQECGCLTRTCGNCYAGSTCPFYKTPEQRQTDETKAKIRCMELSVPYGAATGSGRCK